MTHKNFTLDGRVIVVTGALGILGSVYCDILADAGATLIMTDLDDVACRKRADDLSGKFGRSTFGIEVDVGEENSIAAFTAYLDKNNLSPDILINNAATKSPRFFSPLEDFPLADWEHVMRTNVTGAFLMTRTLLPGMIKRGGGNIINIGSIYGLLGPDQRIYEGADYPELGGAINTPLVYAAS
ncbi:MAG: SDR family NAD(P)-dependent oxidoreductase, partial [Rhodospirillales bacterium]